MHPEGRKGNRELCGRGGLEREGEIESGREGRGGSRKGERGERLNIENQTGSKIERKDEWKGRA